MKKPRLSFTRSLFTFYFILLGGQVLLALTLFLLVYFGYLDPYPFESFSKTLSVLGVAIFLICRYGSQTLYKRKMEEIYISDKDLKKKLEEYMAANIQRWAILEFAILFFIILTYLSGTLSMYILTGFTMFLFLLLMPSASKTIDELHIDVDNFR